MLEVVTMMFFEMQSLATLKTYHGVELALAKGTVFFFHGKVCGHSLTRFQKKIQLYFFFPERVYMPLTQLFRRSLNKK